MAQPTYPILPGVPENDWRNTIAGFTMGAAPSNAIGVEGNFFIDVSTGTIWGAKSSSAWPGPSGYLLSGGANTIIGNTEGAAPSDTVGSNGFYFLDLDTSLVFGPKASGTWPPDGVALGSIANIIWGDSGGGPPDSGIGKDGDYFWDVSTSAWYGPKTTVWPITPVPVAGGVNAIWGATNGAPDNSVGIVGSFFFDVVQLKWYGPKTTTWPASGGFAFDPAQVDANTVTGDAGGSAPSNTIGMDGEYFLDVHDGSVYGPKSGGTWPGSPIFTIPITNVDGNTVTGGSGGSPPSNSIGIDGDFFFDLDSGTVYGPKASGAWPGSGTLLTPSNTITGNSGGSAPSNGIGLDGDFFIDYSTGRIFGPKNSGAWPPDPVYDPSVVGVSGKVAPIGAIFCMGFLSGAWPSPGAAESPHPGTYYDIIGVGLTGSPTVPETFINFGPVVGGYDVGNQASGDTSPLGVTTSYGGVAAFCRTGWQPSFVVGQRWMCIGTDQIQRTA